MKIALAQLNFRIADFEGNKNKILQMIAKGKEAGADLIIFSELAVCGYPPRDFLTFKDFISECYKSLKSIAKHTQNLACIIGSPSLNLSKRGKPLYNSGFFIYQKKIQQNIHKTLLPTYDVFDEYRYFEPNRSFKVIKFKGLKIALTICEDLWNVGSGKLYYQNPMDVLKKQKPDFIINLSASPFSWKQPDIRRRIMRENCLKYRLPLFYVNHVGAQTELIFDGRSFVMNSKGHIYEELKSYEEDFRVIELKEVLALKKSNNFSMAEKNFSKEKEIHHALVLGVRDYFKKMGFKKAILGLSGGIDSAVTLVLLCTALGKENVLAVMMPSRYSSDHSISDSKLLVERTGCDSKIIPIEEMHKAGDKTLDSFFTGTIPGLAEENIQARIRAIILMALSNKFQYILINTSNKSEMSVGYGTLYGDMCGGLSILGDLYKTEVYELAHYINKEKEIIPINIISKPPSAELKEGQKDTDTLPDYKMLDVILFNYIEKRKGISELVRMGFEKKLVEKVLGMVNSTEWKRYQTPPVLRVSEKAFGMGRRMPIVARY